MTELKLFVWQEFAPDWFGGLAIAIAKNEKQAKVLIIEDYGYAPDDWGKLKILSLENTCAYCVGGTS